MNINKRNELFEQAVSHITRDGLDNLINWLRNETDFFTAPCSTLFHGNFEGGLLEHSLRVLEFALHNFNRIKAIKPDLEYLKESLIISALLHDVCKVNTYKRNDEKWTKIDNRWAKYSGWDFEDTFPLGHGEKSVYLISKHIELKEVEALAIRWHMSAFEPGVAIEGPTKWAYEAAANHPLVRIIHSADNLATIVETTLDLKSKAIIK